MYIYIYIIYIYKDIHILFTVITKLLYWTRTVRKISKQIDHIKLLQNAHTTSILINTVNYFTVKKKTVFLFFSISITETHYKAEGAQFQLFVVCDGESTQSSLKTAIVSYVTDIATVMKKYLKSLILTHIPTDL